MGGPDDGGRGVKARGDGGQDEFTSLRQGQGLVEAEVVLGEHPDPVGLQQPQDNSCCERNFLKFDSDSTTLTGFWVII